jgi:hypothetical protein
VAWLYAEHFLVKTWRNIGGVPLAKAVIRSNTWNGAGHRGLHLFESLLHIEQVIRTRKSSYAGIVSNMLRDGFKLSQPCPRAV